MEDIFLIHSLNDRQPTFKNEKGEELTDGIICYDENEEPSFRWPYRADRAEDLEHFKATHYLEKKKAFVLTENDFEILLESCFDAARSVNIPHISLDNFIEPDHLTFKDRADFVKAMFKANFKTR